MKRALISDVHGNLEALTAVLADIAEQGIREIYCLGDIVGYGPNPRQCIDLIRQHCALRLLGDLDLYTFQPPSKYLTHILKCAAWTRRQLESAEPSGGSLGRYLEFLRGLELSHRDRCYQFVHGSWRDPIHEYVFPEDIYNSPKMEAIFSLVDRYCFQGHAHIPGVWLEDMTFQSPEQLDYEFKLGDTKALINVGSVGQPRDGDPRACYVALEENPEGAFITFRRIEYPWQITRDKICRIPDIDDFNGDRLGEGR